MARRTDLESTAPPKVSARRAELLAIARDLFGEQGYRNTTVRDIAERANILSGSLFYHFETKESIVEEMLRPYLEEVSRRSHEAVDQAESPADALRSLIDVNIRLGVEKLAETRIIQNDRRHFVQTLPFLSETTREIDKLWMDVLRAGVADGTFRDDIDLGIYFRAIRGAVLEFVEGYQVGRGSVDDVIHTYVTTFMSGVLAESQRQKKRQRAN